FYVPKRLFLSITTRQTSSIGCMTRFSRAQTVISSNQHIKTIHFYQKSRSMKSKATGKPTQTSGVFTEKEKEAIRKGLYTLIGKQLTQFQMALPVTGSTSDITTRQALSEYLKLTKPSTGEKKSTKAT